MNRSPKRKALEDVIDGIRQIFDEIDRLLNGEKRRKPARVPVPVRVPVPTKDRRER
ncbi:MAG: hypothetical protein MUF87_18785 [Anaerolineae bacterium]|nr:hypothetical protein [Anaerolineae bacterium]